MLRAYLLSIVSGSLTVALCSLTNVIWAGPYAPAAGQIGSTAVSKDDPSIAEWASGVAELTRGPNDISNPGLGLATFGTAANALGKAQGTSTDVVSLGDGGHITLTFDRPIYNGPGADLAVFENGFSDTFLELSFVEVSSDGVHYFRFPNASLTQTTTQIGAFDQLDPTNLDGLAGKYRQGFGTPFDLQDLAGVSPSLDVNDVQYVRIVDVVGSINPLYATHDTSGRIINDPWPTSTGGSGGFDLDAVAVINAVPEPSGLLLAVCGGVMLLTIYCARGRRARD